MNKKQRVLPDKFLWGLATSNYQIEWTWMEMANMRAFGSVLFVRPTPSRTAPREMWSEITSGVCGDSSGGIIAATLALMTRGRFGPALIFQLLMYLMLDLNSSETQSYIEHGYKVLGLTRAKMIWARDSCLAKLDDRVTLYPSPHLAYNLAGVSTTKIITEKCDPLLDGGEAFTQKLGEAGVEVSHTCYQQ